MKKSKKIWGTEYLYHKLIEVNEGECLSLQYHPKKTEIWKILKIGNGARVFVAGAQGQTAYNEATKPEIGAVYKIPPNTAHRAWGHILIEEWSDRPDKTVRLDDKYGRT